MSEPELTPQEPGALPTVDQSHIDTLAGGKVADLVAKLADLTDDELEQLLAAEQAGSQRTTALSAITTEQARREANNARVDDVDPPVPAIAGNAEDYRNGPASAVNLDAITQPVLTRDGWVMPRQRAEAQG